MTWREANPRQPYGQTRLRTPQMHHRGAGAALAMRPLMQVSEHFRDILVSDKIQHVFLSLSHGLPELTWANASLTHLYVSWINNRKFKRDTDVLLVP